MTLHPIFKECCGTNARYALDKPFRRGDKVYATDGAIIVRCPAEGLRIQEVVGVPPPELLDWTRARWASTALTLPKVKASVKIECENCKGRRTVYVGFAKQRKCPDCKGTGQVDWDEDPIKIPKTRYRLRRRYVHLLQRFGARVYAAATCTDLHPLYFEIPGTGVDGMVMPMRVSIEPLETNT
jgi:hypothetical protein